MWKVGSAAIQNIWNAVRRKFRKNLLSFKGLTGFQVTAFSTVNAAATVKNEPKTTTRSFG